MRYMLFLNPWAEELLRRDPPVRTTLKEQIEAEETIELSIYEFSDGFQVEEYVHTVVLPTNEPVRCLALKVLDDDPILETHWKPDELQRWFEASSVGGAGE